MSRIYFAQRVLRRQHLVLLDVCKDRDANLQLQAGWALGEWCSIICDIFLPLFDLDALRCLNLLQEESSSSSQSEDAMTFLKLLVRTASAKAWSMLVWSNSPPLNWAGILHCDATLREEALVRMKEDCAIVLAARDYVEKKNDQWQATRLKFLQFLLLYSLDSLDKRKVQQQCNGS